MGVNVERLYRLLEAHGVDIPEGATFHRVHTGDLRPGREPRSWFVADADGHEIVGSAHPAAKLLAAKHVTVTRDLNGSRNVTPADPVPVDDG